MTSQCQHYLPRKSRTCSLNSIKGQSYCGNHLLLYDGKAAEESVTCPFGPEHKVKKAQLDDHLLRCNFRPREQVDAWSRPGHNAGQAVAHIGQPVTVEDVLEFVCRLEAALQQVCLQEEPGCVLRPTECEPYLQPDKARPFSQRHALQQASILGHAQQAGLLQAPQETVYLDFGAGKGYLSSMLHSAFSPQHVIMLDCDSFRLKADRYMRQTSFERIRLDLADFWPAGHLRLKGRQPWAALGKHLCGGATDFALRCCADSLQAGTVQQQPSSDQQGSSEGCTSDQQSGTQPASSPSGTQAGVAVPADGDSSPVDGRPSATGLLGLVVATCCHHRCTWQAYVATDWWLKLGLSPQDFCIASWMTGWAAAGHGPPKASASEHSSSDEGGYQPDAQATSTGFRLEAADDGRPAVPATETEAPSSPASPHAAQNGEAGFASSGRQPPPAQALPGSKSPSLAGQLVSPVVRAALAARLPLPERQRLGAGCKQLLDQGRMVWLQQQGFQVSTRLYATAEMAGERRLLVATSRANKCHD